MAAPLSPFATTTRAIRSFLHEALAAQGKAVVVTVGNPKLAVPQPSQESSTLNLFVYHVMPSAFDAAVSPTDPRWFRLYCLITPMNSDLIGADGRLRSAGEADLDVLGEVVRILHETPVTAPIFVDDLDAAVRLQSIQLLLSAEELNNIWSTQGDVLYRPSVAYEFALVPVVPHRLPPTQHVVGGIGIAVGSTRTPDATVVVPGFPGGSVNVDDPDWAPLICFLEAGSCGQSLFVPADRKAATTFAVWVAGATGGSAKVFLQWQVWSRRGWEKVGGAVPVEPATTRIDTSNPIPDPLTMAPPETTASQWLLYAERHYESPLTPVENTALSNPLLVTVVPQGRG